MKNKVTTFAALVAGTIGAAVAGSAQAQTTTGTPPAFATIFTQGDTTLPGYANASVFQNFASDPTGVPYAPLPNETVSGDVQVMQGTVPGISVQPTASSSNYYLDIVNGSYGVTLAQPSQFFSFVFGSLDNYNTLTLDFADGSTETLSGTQIIGQTGTGPFNSPYYGRVSYDVGGGSSITGATFSSTQAAFEIDSLASAVPEASTWAMMMVGVGAVGASLRRRKVATTSVRFA